MRLRTDGHPDWRGPAIEQAVSAFKGEAAELYVASIVQSAHPGDGGVIDDGADLEAKVLCWGELCSQLACQHCIRPVRLAEASNSFRFDFLLPQLTHIGTLCKAEDELRIDIARTRCRGRQQNREHQNAQGWLHVHQNR